MRRILLIIITLAALGGGGWLAWQRFGSQGGAVGEAGGAHSGLGKTVEPQKPTPVLTAVAVQNDMPVTLEGLGSVAAFYTVALKPQVDGRLTEVLFTEGQAVKKGDVLAKIDARPYRIALRQAEAVHDRDLAQLKNSKLNLQRYQELRKQNLVPTQQVSDQAAQVDQLQAQVRADESQEDSARLLLDYAQVVAPIDGVTGVRLADPGNMVRAADATGIVVLTQLDPIAVLFTLPEDDLPAIQRGMAQGKLAVDAYGRDGVTKLATGQLEVIDNLINQATATVRLKAIFPNPQHVLWPNQFVKARVQVAVRSQVVVVPAVAVQHGPKGTFVYVVAPDKSAQVRPIEVQALEGDVAILSKGLQAGEVVVVDGQSRLKPGAKVALPGDVTDTKGGEGKGGEGKGGRGDKGPMGGKPSK